MQVEDIICTYKEYLRGSSGFVKTAESSFKVNNMYINNMIESSTYFSQLGGYMNIEQKPNRRFGLVPTKIVCVSICGAIKKVFTFNYNQARV